MIMNITIFNLSVVMLLASPSAHAINIGELIVSLGTGLISKEICKDLGANNNWQAACAIGGGLLGAEVYRQINAQDALEIERAQEEAFRGRVNSRHEWDGSRRGSTSGYRGDLIVVEEGYHYQTRETCRVIRNEVYYPRNYSNIPSEVTTSTICRNSRGVTYKLTETDYFRNGHYSGSQSVETVPQQRRCEGWSPRGINRNDQVITSRGQFVTVINYIENEDAVVVREHGRRVYYSLNEIALIGCFYGIKTGSRINHRGQSVQVVGIFRSGDLAVDDGYEVFRIRK